MADIQLTKDDDGDNACYYQILSNLIPNATIDRNLSGWRPWPRDLLSITEITLGQDNRPTWTH